MKCFTMLMTLVLCLAPFSQAQDKTPEQTAVEKLINFYKQMGDEATAKRLQDGWGDGSVKFGPTPDNDNAAINMRTKKITINPSTLKGLDAPGLESWRATADLAATVFHELNHKDQDYWSWCSSTWKEFAGYGNTCEQEAWGGTLETLAQWVHHTKQELDSKSNKSVREQADAAQRLKLICETFEVLRNDYVGRKGKIGDLTLIDPKGMPISLEDLLAEIEGLKEGAEKLIVTAKGMVRSFDGIYNGSFQGQGNGQIGFRVQGLKVDGKIAGAYKGEQCKGNITGSVNSDGKLELNLNGEIISGKNYPFTGKLNGWIQNGRADGEWFASNQYGSPSGSWSAAQK
ncbi:MAG: hypothetical protein AB9873_14855 [Syntrophobacteraceae bacterium]